MKPIVLSLFLLVGITIVLCACSVSAVMEPRQTSVDCLSGTECKGPNTGCQKVSSWDNTLYCCQDEPGQQCTISVWGGSYGAAGCMCQYS